MVRHAALIFLLGYCLGCGLDPAQALPSSVSFHSAIGAFRAAPASEQERRARRARDVTHEWLKLYVPDENGDKPRMSVRSALIRSMARHLKRNLVNIFEVMPGAVEDFLEALRQDPTYLEAHVALARLYYESGRRERAIVHGEFVRDYVEEEAESLRGWDAIKAPWMAYETSFTLAWAYRERGEWEKGLAMVETAERFRQDHGLGELYQLTLLKGLLLAGAGRGAEALRVAGGALPSFMSRKLVNCMQWAPYRRVSVYAQDWIQSQVFLQEGEYGLAMTESARSTLPNRKDWNRLPYFRQYWNDVGFLFELRGEPAEAARWYGQLKNLRGDWFLFFKRYREDPATPFIADLPGRQVFHVRTKDHDYLWGSPFSYVAEQFQRLASNTDLDSRDARDTKRKIMEIVESLEARRVRPDFCHALRGRIAYLDDEFATAEVELTAAHELFIGRGVVDAGTSLILGLVKLRLGKEAEAEVFLAEARDNALALRGLGVIVARKGEFSRALAIMDQALELEPRSVAGWYNRGMLLYENGRYREAARDFHRAYKLDPENSYVLARAERCENSVAALELDPVTGPDYLHRGQLFLEAGAYERAHADLLEAFRLSPERSREIAPLLQEIVRTTEVGGPAPVDTLDIFYLMDTGVAGD